MTQSVLTDEEYDVALAIEKDRIKENPLALVHGEYLRIKTKEAQLINLVPNKTQKFVLEKIKELRRLGKPVRLWIRKARQEGISTVVEGIIYAITSQKDNSNALIMADEKEHANNLFEMSKLYHEEMIKLYPHLVPEVKRSNEKKLEFKGTNSQIIIATAENVDAARSHTFQLVHLSETAFFRQFKEVMIGLNQSVPHYGDTIIIGETTSNGIEESLDEWEKAVNGKSEWCALFIPWFWLDEYAMPMINGKMYSIDGIVFDDSDTYESFMREEQELKRAHNLSNEQLNWRRWAIVNKCQGDMPSFRQEYPSTWQESIKMSGNVFFSRKGMEKQRKEEREPLHIGNIYKDGFNEFVFRKEPNGKIRLYEVADEDEEYIVICDASKARGIDEASIYVGNARMDTTAAVVSGMYEEDELGDLCVLLAEWYNGAMVVPENSCGYGNAVTKRVYSQYGNIWCLPERLKPNMQPQDFGFLTTSKTRNEMLSYLAEGIRRGSLRLFDKDTIRQHETFIINKTNKKPEAASGKQDGIVICRGIFSYVRRTCTYESLSNKRNKRKSRHTEPVNFNKKAMYGKGA